MFVCFLGVTTLLVVFFHSPVAGFSLLIRGFLIIRNSAPQSVGLLWTSDQSVVDWRNISTIYTRIYNKTSIKRNILIIKQKILGIRSG